MSEVSIKSGTKLSEAEQKAVDPKQIGRMYAQPRKSDVEPETIVLQRCPCCGCIGYGDVSAYAFRYFTCHCCGCVFRM